jgi:antitoxin (DNA-binding transcriptional repressor) of toxin-antitoxin stability system
MHQVNLQEAGTQLAESIEEAASSEEVSIADSDGTAFEIVQTKSTKPRPVFCSAKGSIEMSDDFDDLENDVPLIEKRS